MLRHETEDLVAPIDAIQQTVTDIKTTINNPKLLKVKKDTLKILQEYPLTYKEFEEYIIYLNQIKDNSTLMVFDEIDESVMTITNIKDDSIPLKSRISLNNITDSLKNTPNEFV